MRGREKPERTSPKKNIRSDLAPIAQPSSHAIDSVYEIIPNGAAASKMTKPRWKRLTALLLINCTLLALISNVRCDDGTCVLRERGSKMAIDD